MYSIVISIPGHGKLFKAGFATPEDCWAYYVQRCRPGVASEIIITKHED